MSITTNMKNEIYDEFADYLRYLLKYKKIIIPIYLLVEIVIFMQIGRSNTFMMLSSLFISLFILCSVFLMFKDFRTTLRIFAISIPLIPIIQYLLFRLNMEWLGGFIYVFYFVIFLLNSFRELKSGNINFRVFKKNKSYLLVGIIYLILTILGILSVANSRYKLEAFNFLFLGFIIMIVFSIIIISYTGEEKDFINDIIFYLCIGVALSGIPDTLIAFYTILTTGTNQHLYGALGSNFMLGYTIIALPFIVYNSVNKVEDNKRYYMYNLMMFIEIFVLATQRSRGILLTLVVCFLLIFLLNVKKKLKYLLITGIVLISVTYNVTYRPEFNEFRETLKENPEVTVNIFSKNQFINNLLQQTKNRRPIWGITFNVIADHPYYGIGPGHYKYYYLEYGGSVERSYKDSHNVILNIVVDLGIPFATVFFLSVFVLWLKAFIKGIKIKEIKEKKPLFLCCIGIMCFMIYGNITGQAFMTFVSPISIVPAFVFTVITTAMVLKTS